MTGLSYQASLDFLFNLEKSGIKLGLERTAALLSAAVSMAIVLLSTWLRPAEFDWSMLATSREAQS